MTKEKIVKDKIVKEKPVKDKIVKEKPVKEKPVKEKSVVEPAVKQKRGRKSKKELQLAIDQKLVEGLVQESQSKDTNSYEDNITCSIQEIQEVTNDTTNDDTNIDDTTQKPGAKKRGRKPKGGKIIQQITNSNINTNSKPNIILHLKCSLKDLQTNTLLSSNVESYNFSVCKGDLSYDVINSSDASLIKNSYMDVSNEKLNSSSNNSNTSNTSNNNTNTNNSNKKSYDDENSYPYDDDDDSSCNKDLETKEIWRKLKQLEHNLHINNISDKKSACFWCTYEFDNPPVYIPKHFIKNSYQVYGCFCSPECSTAYLMEENIDSSIKFERYHLINHIYSQIYDYKKNIKPAPNPYYMLEKYYGNLNIQEYRSLLRNDRLFLIVDKPLTRILPELHEDNDDFIINNKIIPSNTYQIKKKLQRKTQTQNKNNIFNEKFNSQQ